MTKYEQFLDSNHIISEKDFNEVLDSLPEIDIESIEWDEDMRDYDQDLLSRTIIDNLIAEIDYVYVDDISFSDKAITLGDVDNLEDLNEIKELLPKWTIENYDEIIEDIKERSKEEKDEEEFDRLLNTIRFKASLDQLKKFVETL